MFGIFKKKYSGPKAKKEFQNAFSHIIRITVERDPSISEKQLERIVMILMNDSDVVSSIQEGRIQKPHIKLVALSALCSSVCKHVEDNTILSEPFAEPLYLLLKHYFEVRHTDPDYTQINKRLMDEIEDWMIQSLQMYENTKSILSISNHK
ncbi:hypothetical protein VCRA2113O415_1130001 [Vibrio crassostreae]|nr:hypothetical protein VCRA2113O415_1130001 [Vibrio crassostreae]CAK3016400.1 hypothetical protein VCRA2113O420_980001 [Vibrio crassostreae]CAK3624012.1 hypothetical protein VCRA2121O436_960002 [Vibrio crassostreae]